MSSPKRTGEPLPAGSGSVSSGTRKEGSSVAELIQAVIEDVVPQSHGFDDATLVGVCVRAVENAIVDRSHPTSKKRKKGDGSRFGLLDVLEFNKQHVAAQAIHYRAAYPPTKRLGADVRGLLDGTAQFQGVAEILGLLGRGAEVSRLPNYAEWRLVLLDHAATSLHDLAHTMATHTYRSAQLNPTRAAFFEPLVEAFHGWVFNHLVCLMRLDGVVEKSTLKVIKDCPGRYARRVCDSDPRGTDPTDPIGIDSSSEDDYGEEGDGDFDDSYEDGDDAEESDGSEIIDETQESDLESDWKSDGESDQESSVIWADYRTGPETKSRF